MCLGGGGGVKKDVESGIGLNKVRVGCEAGRGGRRGGVGKRERDGGGGGW